MVEKVTKLALTSRVIVLVLQLLANLALPDHRPDVFRTPHSSINIGQEHANAAWNNSNDTLVQRTTWLDKAVQSCLGGLRHWDGEYFLHIAEHTYSYEQTLAFYPLYPLVVRSAAHALHYLGLGLSLTSWNLVVAALINVFCFCKATSMLYNLTQRIFKDLNKSWNAALLFCLNPASIFFTAAYSEALFCLISFYLMLECVTEQRLLRTTSALALSIVSRANGIVNMGFPIYFIVRRMLLTTAGRYFAFMKLLFCLLAACVPLTFYYFYAFQQFCMPDKYVPHTAAVQAYARQRHYVLAGRRQPHNSPWCDETFPFPYSYIQSHYWGVGFLRYYKLKQLPNFMLALPVLLFLLYHCYTYLKHFVRVLLQNQPLRQLLKEHKALPFVLHALFLCAFCIGFVHIQISTRLLCSATPCLYWFAADHLPRTFDQIKLRSKAGAILCWFTGYCVLGSALFSNNLPWT